MKGLNMKRGIIISLQAMLQLGVLFIGALNLYCIYLFIKGFSSLVENLGWTLTLLLIIPIGIGSIIVGDFCIMISKEIWEKQTNGKLCGQI